MQAKVLATRTIGEVTLEAVLGDLTAEEVDAIVNAANTQLAHGGGLAAAIVRRGGIAIQRESDRLAPVPVGGVAVTTAGELRSRWVIHAVGPRWGEGDEEAKLRSAVAAALAEADRLGARSIALPAISTGIFGYPKQSGTRHAAEEVARWVRDNPTTGLTTIRLTAFDAETANSFVTALEDLQATSVPDL